MRGMYKNQMMRCVYGLLMMVFMVSCSQDLTYQEAKAKNQQKLDDPDLLADAEFLIEAKSFNLLESQLVDLARQTAYASTVVELSKQNFEDHQLLEKEIDKLARKKKVKMPSSMNEEHQQLYNEVAASDKENFDKTFVRVLKQINEQNTDRYMSMATDAHDPDVRAYSARKLDMLRTHSKKIDEVDDELLRTY